MMAAAAAARTVQLTVYLSDGIKGAHEPFVSVLVDECASAHDVVRAAATKARLVNPNGFELAEVFVTHGQPRKARRLEPTQHPHRLQSSWPQAAPASHLPEELDAEYRFYLVRKDVPSAAATVTAVTPMTSGPAVAPAAAGVTSPAHELGEPTSAAVASMAAAGAGTAAAGSMAVAAGTAAGISGTSFLQTAPGMLRTLAWSECSNAGVPPDPFLVNFLNQRWDGADCADLCRLPSLDERSMLQNLRQRFGDRNAYTYVGSILVAVNPFQFFPVYNPKYVRMYEGRRLGELPPHIFAVADAAFHSMIETRQSQCVVISGESGSGKTESTNFLLHHLTHLSHKGAVSNGAGVERTLLGAGPVLEAFGNAKTVHNNNSSRFGKFIQVNYRKNGTVNGAVVEKYLLEKSRIVSQPREERNYHVFYYLLGGAPTDVQQVLSLEKPSDYNYLNQSGCYEVSDVDNHDEYRRLLQSMEIVGFSVEIQKKILAVLATVLHLGNIDFQKKHDYHHDEAVLIANTDVLTIISGLLCVKEDTLLEALTSRRTVAGGETVVVNYKRPDAIAQRDAMAKCLYGALFDWIVLQINHALLVKQDSHELLGNSIGVLDIFGFEDFKMNGFEQFCINYANEHLQYYFNQHIFKFEQEEYQKEGIVWKNIEFIDNTGCIDLFAKRPKGLFFLLDEEGNFPGATNDTLLEKFNQNHRSNVYYQMPTKKESTFIICHYAGRVKYHIQDFREKNNDHMRPDIVSVLKNSSLSFVKELVGSSPVAMLRWAYLRVCIKSLWAFIDAGRRFYRAGGAKIGVRRRQSVQKVGQRPPQSSRDSDVPDAADDVTDGAYATNESVDRPVFQDESDSAADSFIYKGGSDTKTRRKSSKSKHRSKSRLWKGTKDLQTLQDARETTKSKTPTISLQFQHSLGLLLRELDKASPYFVRCIKSNESQAPNFFDDDVVLRQLRYTGMLATIKIRQSGYNCRTTFEDFVRQYRALLPKGASSDKDDIKKFLSDIDCKGNFQIGMTKVFLRETLKILLDQALDHALTARIVKIQRWVRARLRRLHYVRMQTAAQVIQKCWRHWLLCTRARIAKPTKETGTGADSKCKESLLPAIACATDVEPKEGDRRPSRTLADQDSLLPVLTGFRSVNRSPISPAGRLSRDDSQFERDFESVVDQGVDRMSSFSSGSSASDADDDEPRLPASCPVPESQQLPATGLFQPTTIEQPQPAKAELPQPVMTEAPLPQPLSPRPPPLSPRPRLPVRGHTPPLPQPLAPSPQPPAEVESHVATAGLGNTSAMGSVVEPSLPMPDVTAQPASSGDTSCPPRAPPHGVILVTTPSSRQLLPFEAGEDEGSAEPAIQDASARCDEPAAQFPGENGADRSVDSPAPLDDQAADGTRRDSRASIGSYGSSSTSGSSNLGESTNAMAATDASMAAETKGNGRRVQRPLNFGGSAHASPRVPQRALIPQDEHARHGALEGIEFDRFSVYRKGIKKSHSADSIPVAQGLPAPVTQASATPEPDLGSTEKPPLIAKSSLPSARRSDESLDSMAVTAEGKKRSAVAAAAEDMRSPMSLKSTIDDWAQERPRSPSSSSSTSKGHILSRLKNKLTGTRSLARNVPDDMELVDLKHSTLTPATKQLTEQGPPADIPSQGPAESPVGAVVPQLGRSRSSRVKGNIVKDVPPAPRATTPVAPTTATQWNVSGTSQWQYPENWEIRTRATLYKMYELIHHKKMDFNKSVSKDKEVPVFERVFRDALTEFERSLFVQGATNADEMFAPIKYRDLMDRFSQMLTKAIRQNVQPPSTGEFPSILVINAFRGYLDEFHKQNGDYEKHVKKPKKKKEKTKGNQAAVVCGHRLFPMTISIKTFCEVCNKLITFFDKGLECEACKFTCHKNCTSKCTGVCTVSQQKAESVGGGFVFGRRLSQLISDEDHPVPLLFEKLLQAVETKGLLTEGIYRKSGLAERVKILKKAIDTTANPENIDFHEYAVHVLTSTVKSFLRDLSEPLLTYSLYSEFVRAADVEDEGEALRILKASVEKLPPCNNAVLLRLLVHLATVAQNESTNRMSANALAIVFSPCLLKSSGGNTLGRSGGGGPSGVKRASMTGSQAVQESLKDVPRQVRCVELLIDWMLRRLNSTFDDLEALDRAEQQATARLTKVRASMRSGRRKTSHLLPLPLSKNASDGPEVSQALASSDVTLGDVAASGAALQQSGGNPDSPITPSDEIDPEVADVLLRRYTKDLEDVKLKRSHMAHRLAKMAMLTDDEQLSTDDIDTSGDSIDDISLEENGSCRGLTAAAATSTAAQSSTTVSTPVVSLPSVPEIAE